MIAAADHQVESIERLALIIGWLVFAIPVAVVVAFWLPRRIRFYRQARAAQHFIDSSADLDLFALRAMASQPMHVLAAVSDDPVAAWRTGDRAVINELAELELERSGCACRPAWPRSPGCLSQILELRVGRHEGDHERAQRLHLAARAAGCPPGRLGSTVPASPRPPARLGRGCG